MKTETENMIRSLSDSELTDLRNQIEARVDDARHSYIRKVTEETAAEYFAVIDDEELKRNNRNEL